MQTTAFEGAWDYITIDRLPSGWYVLRINGGVKQTVRNGSAINDSLTTPFLVGSIASPSASQGPFQGLIDSVRITMGRNRNPAFQNIDVPAPYPVIVA